MAGARRLAAGSTAARGSGGPRLDDEFLLPIDSLLLQQLHVHIEGLQRQGSWVKV